MVTLQGSVPLVSFALSDVWVTVFGIFGDRDFIEIVITIDMLSVSIQKRNNSCPVCTSFSSRTWVHTERTKEQPQSLNGALVDVSRRGSSDDE